MKIFYSLALSFSLAALGSAQVKPVASAEMQNDLDAIAHVGSVMLDGDVCQKIVTQRAKDFMFSTDPSDPWIAGDNYDVDGESFNAVKKTLIRLSHLARFPADLNLWMPIEGHSGKIQIVVRNKNEMSQFWTWGALYQDMPPEMGSVLKTGQRLTVTRRPGWVSILAPVYNSLGDIVGLIEAVSRVETDPHENVK
jgi:hypothetical protein